LPSRATRYAPPVERDERAGKGNNTRNDGASRLGALWSCGNADTTLYGKPELRRRGLREVLRSATSARSRNFAYYAKPQARGWLLSASAGRPEGRGPRFRMLRAQAWSGRVGDRFFLQEERYLGHPAAPSFPWRGCPSRGPGRGVLRACLPRPWRAARRRGHTSSPERGRNGPSAPQAP
jgi:hypothetical protein